MSAVLHSGHILGCSRCRRQRGLETALTLLVTPDPLYKPGLRFEPVFDYEQVLVVSRGHALAGAAYAKAQQLTDEVLITYPVAVERLDIYNQFLMPAGVTPKQHKTIETTDIMLQMVSSGRGVAALPRWLVQEYAGKMGLVPVRLGRHGIAKQIFLGARESDVDIDYLKAFVELARLAPDRGGTRPRKAP